MSTITKHTRKPIDKLLPSDFDAFPIWEFALDEEGVSGQDETWVRPVIGKFGGVGDDIHVACDFWFPDDRVYRGFVSFRRPLDANAPPFCGVILDKKKYLFLPKFLQKKPGVFFSADLLKQRCDELRISIDGLKEVVVRLKTLLPGDKRYRVFNLYPNDA